MCGGCVRVVKGKIRISGGVGSCAAAWHGAVTRIGAERARGRGCENPENWIGSGNGQVGGAAAMELRMDLSRIVIHDSSEQQIIFLRERGGHREFPIVIGDAEACAIDRRLKGYKRARPMTHDLMSDIIEGLHGELEKIVINDLKNHTFYAKLVVRCRGEVIEIDSRPSDAIALGVANETPIFVSEHVLREVCQS